MRRYNYEMDCDFVEQQKRTKNSLKYIIFNHYTHNMVALMLNEKLNLQMRNDPSREKIFVSPLSPSGTHPAHTQEQTF